MKFFPPFLRHRCFPNRSNAVTKTEMATPTLTFIIELAGVVAGVAAVGLAGLEVGSELGKEAVVEHVFEESDGGT